MGRACSRMNVGRSAFKILTGKPKGKRPLGRPRCSLLNLINDIISMSSYKLISSKLFLLFQVALIFTAPNILQRAFLSKTTNLFVVSVFKVQASAP